MPPDSDSQANHIKGSTYIPTDAKDLQWCTRAQNLQHAYDTGLNPRKRAVTATSKDEKEQEFDSAAEAMREMAKNGVKVDYRNIQKACSGKINTLGGFKWRYADGGTAKKQKKVIFTLSTSKTL